jgi:HlyD family secretion protein
MFRKYIIPLVALAGLAFAIFTVIWGDKTPPSAPPVSQASQSPYQASVAGSGIVEANTENISVGTQISGIVSRIYIRIGSDLVAGDPLFSIDDRSIVAELKTRKAAVQIAEAELDAANFEFTIAESLESGTSISAREYQKRRFAVIKSKAQLAQAQAELTFGETNLELHTIRAPVDGQVLQLKVHPGEAVLVGPVAQGASPLLVLGNVNPLHVRVDVDENDAWRVDPDTPAMGYLRGNRHIKTPLTFVRFEPYVIPKKSLTGDSTERVDTRVLQVIFSFKNDHLPSMLASRWTCILTRGRVQLAGIWKRPNHIARQTLTRLKTSRYNWRKLHDEHTCLVVNP